MDRKFLKPFAASVAALLTASQAEAALPSMVSDATVDRLAKAKPTANAEVVLGRSEATQQMASHASHSSHSSHASHASHSSHYSSSF